MERYHKIYLCMEEVRGIGYHSTSVITRVVIGLLMIKLTTLVGLDFHSYKVFAPMRT